MEIMDLPRKLSTKLTTAPKALASAAIAAPQACLDTATNLCESARGAVTDGFPSADLAVEQLADQSRKLKALAVKNGNFAQAGGGAGPLIVRGGGAQLVGEVALGGKDAPASRGPVTVDEAISFIAENWKNSGLEPGIYNRLAVLSMNGKIDIGDYGVDGNAAEYTLTGRMKVNRDVLGLRTDYDEFDAYSVEAMWNAHLWRTLPEDRRIIEGIDSNTISGSQAATKTPVFSKIPRR